MISGSFHKTYISSVDWQCRSFFSVPDEVSRNQFAARVYFNVFRLFFISLLDAPLELKFTSGKRREIGERIKVKSGALVGWLVGG